MFSAWHSVRWDLGDALAEGLLAGSFFIAAAALGVLAWQRPTRAIRWVAGPMALIFSSFGLLHAVQTEGHGASPLLFKGLAALAGLGMAGLVALLTRWLLSRPGLGSAPTPPPTRAKALDPQAGEPRWQDQNLESLGPLAGGLAHDFNNLLGAMAGNLELARLETVPESAVAAYLEPLETLVNRAAALVQQVLAYTGGGQAQREPLDLNEQVERTLAVAAALASSHGGSTVLVVDDEDPLRTMAVKALRRIGFHTLEARDGLEALQVFEAHRERIKLVLMDLTMPHMGGEEAYRVLRRSGVLVPVILSSGFTEQDVLRHFHGRGIAGFLQKPYRLETLLTSIRNALEKDGRTGDPRARPPLTWCRDMATNIPILDHQHRGLMEAYNALVVTVHRAQPQDRQERAFLKFKERALTHFGTEDRLMQRSAYPRAREHQANHASLIAQVDHLARQIQSGVLTFTPAVMDFLEGWLIHHMQEADQLLGKFLHDQGN